jgi:S-adenosylmethionine uptake transporter
MNKRVLGVLWFVFSLLVSSGNDIITKYLSANLSVYQVVFLRFMFGTLVLLPFMLYNKGSFKTKVIGVQFIRGVLLFGGMLLWCKGLTLVKVSTATVINFTIPIFVLILAALILKETFNIVRFMATVFSLVGIVLVLMPSSSDFNILSILLVLSALMFASLDVINKKFISNEGMLVMLFYSSFFTMLLSAVPAYMTWIMPSKSDVILFFVLGIGANLILYCLLKAFKIVEASFVAPYRYLEFIFSAVMGYVFFLEVPDRTTFYGAIVIVISTLVVVYESFFVKVLKKSRSISVKNGKRQ